MYKKDFVLNRQPLYVLKKPRNLKIENINQ